MGRNWLVKMDKTTKINPTRNSGVPETRKIKDNGNENIGSKTRTAGPKKIKDIIFQPFDNLPARMIPIANLKRNIIIRIIGDNMAKTPAGMNPPGHFLFV